MAKNHPYNSSIHFWFETPGMPKIKHEEATGFGARLAELRKRAGFTQQELADEIGVSRRMIAYYEVQSEHPPTTLLPAIAKALNVSTDELLGASPVPKAARPKDSRLHRRLQQIEKLDPAEKRQVLQLIDAFIERGQLKRKVAERRTS
jgi:transcriptional regulator with XRE-family HTH domain